MDKSIFNSCILKQVLSGVTVNDIYILINLIALLHHEMLCLAMYVQTQ